MSAVKYQGNAHVPLVAQDNIDTFTKGAVEYGLPDSLAFISTDLYEAHKGNFYNVIRCLDQLGVEVGILALYSGHCLPVYNNTNNNNSNNN